MLNNKEQLLKDANHVMTVCNSCRYCEGFCAVFPAMELRRVFTTADLKFFANLCHNCRGCYYACQFVPPHEYDLNIPKTMAELRLETHKEFVWPEFLQGFFEGSATRTTLLSMICVLFVFFVTLISQGGDVLFGRHVGAGAFYNVTPYLAVMIPFSLIGLGVLFVWAMGVGKFWKAIGAPLSDLNDIGAHIQAIKDVLALRYLGGGGHGCNYPDEAFSMNRRWFHQAVFFGFISCFAATSLAFIYEHFLGWPSPFPVISLPVVLGTLGGIAICVGAGGLLYFKEKMDQAPSSPIAKKIDKPFIILVLLTAASGLLVLLFRETHLMGLLLTIHLGFVLAFFVALPYGKGLHALYRYFALVRNAQEQRRADELHVGG